MNKIKLPRKRKKAFIKSHKKGDYMMLVILGEILMEEGRPNSDRFYTYSPCKPTRQHPNGFKPTKRW